MKRINKNKGTKTKKTNKVIDLILLIIFTILTVWLIINIISLSNIENILRIIVIIVLVIILGLLAIFRKKKKLLCRIIIIILSLGYGVLNFTFYKVYDSLNSITEKVETKGICLVTYLEDVKDIKDITKDDIAILGSSMDEHFYEMAEDVIKEEKLKNKLVEYEGYFEIIDALLNKEIKYAFLPENYNDIYNATSGEDEPKELGFNVLYTEQKVIKVEKEEINTKMLDEPFTILLMGTDVILDSYNADTLMVLSVNPKTLKATMLSIPRDTYTTIACTGGKHKINSSGWYGDSCVVKTVSKYLNVDIDYYAKINFLGIVDLVNNLGGIEVDVPYALCEQNSKRQFGEHMIYVDAGKQTLNGEQALALSRNRHYWSGMCPKKYTTDGNRNDITRGLNQQLVIKAILSKLMSVRDLNSFYSILDTVGNNMTTNMPKETILSFYNVGKEIVKRLNTTNTDEIININRLQFKSYSTRILISGLELSMIVNYDESVKYITNEMKKTLGLVKEENITDFSFDVNEDYDPDKVKYSKLTSNLQLLPNFVGKNISEALSYCNSKGLKCESSGTNSNGVIATQSIGAKTDISTIRNKTILFGISTPVVDNTPDIDEKPENNTESTKPPKDDVTDNNTGNNDGTGNDSGNGSEENTEENSKPSTDNNSGTDKEDNTGNDNKEEVAPPSNEEKPGEGGENNEKEEN